MPSDTHNPHNNLVSNEAVFNVNVSKPQLAPKVDTASLDALQRSTTGDVVHVFRRLKSVDFFNISLDPFTPPGTPPQLDSPSEEDDAFRDHVKASLKIEIPQTYAFDYNRLTSKLDGYESESPASSSGYSSPMSVSSRSSSQSSDAEDSTTDPYSSSNSKRQTSYDEDEYSRGRSPSVKRGPFTWSRSSQTPFRQSSTFCPSQSALSSTRRECASSTYTTRWPRWPLCNLLHQSGSPSRLATVKVLDVHSDSIRDITSTVSESLQNVCMSQD